MKYNGIVISMSKEWSKGQFQSKKKSALISWTLLVNPFFLNSPYNNCCSFTSMLLLLPLSHSSRVRLCATPSLGFSRQEHWRGLPFPSPMHKTEKWKWSHSVMSDSSRPHGLQPTRLLCPWDSPAKITWVGYHCLLHRSIISGDDIFPPQG